MIFQALQQCYQLMASDTHYDIAPHGQSAVEIAFEIELDEYGEVKGAYDLRQEQKGKKILVPYQKDRSGKNPQPYMFCDKSKYFFGWEIDEKTNNWIETKANLQNCCELHRELLLELDDAGALAMLRFLEKQPQCSERWEKSLPTAVFGGKNLAFRLQGDSGYIHERPLVSARLEQWKNAQSTQESSMGMCLITGKFPIPLAITHQKIKGVLGSQGAGATLAGFNFPAVESYGKRQSLNSPVSQQAMFEYTTALNTLLASKENRLYIGDMTCVFWSEAEVRGEVTGSLFTLLGGVLEEKPQIDTDGSKTVAQVLRQVERGKVIDEAFIQAHETEKIYILGLSPNNARLAVRFWYQDTYGHLVTQLTQHFKDLSLIPPFETMPPPAIRDILQAAAAMNKKENVIDSMEGALLNAILMGTAYPQGFYNAMLSRIRAECGKALNDDKDAYKNNRIFYTQVAFIKAHLNRCRRLSGSNREEISMALKEEQGSLGYQLGRLFAVLERIQQEANGATTIRERFFQSASATPASVYPRLINLAQHHLAKTNNGYYDKLLSGIISQIDEFPKVQDTQEQGEFILGYYHQRQALYTSSKDIATRKDDNNADQ